MDLSIIIVNYQDKDKLSRCLDSIRQADLGGLSYEVILVDNASGDDLSGLSTGQANWRLIQSPKNLGMGGGNNLGIGEAAGEYILILNPDTIIRKDAIPVLWRYLKEHPDTGLVGPKLLYPDGQLQHSCSRFPDFFMPVLRRTFMGDFFKSWRDRFTMNDFDHSSIREVDWLMGSCLMFRKQIPLVSGGIFSPLFDERYFMYFEDTDLCRQAWTKGLKVIYNPEAVLTHDHKRQSARYPWYQAVFKDRLARQHILSWLRYFAKWGIGKPYGAKN